MIRVGITGGIGSGKSSIAHMFELLKVPVYYSDVQAKLLMTQNKDLKHKLKDLLGSECYEASGALNRAYIAEKIFNNQSLLEQVNAIVHPAVEAHFEAFCENHKAEKYVLKEAAILIETGAFKALDKLILVTMREEDRISRIMQRDNSKREEVQAKIAKQWPDKKKAKFADYILENNNEALLIPQILQLHNTFNTLK